MPAAHRGLAAAEVEGDFAEGVEDLGVGEVQTSGWPAEQDATRAGRKSGCAPNSKRSSAAWRPASSSRRGEDRRRPRRASSTPASTGPAITTGVHRRAFPLLRASRPSQTRNGLRGQVPSSRRRSRHSPPWRRCRSTGSAQSSAFANLKDVIELRQIFHRTDPRVEAHIFVAALAFLLTARSRRNSKPPGSTCRPPKRSRGAPHGAPRGVHSAAARPSAPSRAAPPVPPRSSPTLGITHLDPPTPLSGSPTHHVVTIPPFNPQYFKDLLIERETWARVKVLHWPGPLAPSRSPGASTSWTAPPLDVRGLCMGASRG